MFCRGFYILVGMKNTFRQTVRIGGKRTIITTRNGKVTTKAALPLEFELQAAQVRALRAMPEYARAARDVRPGTFTLAADQNAARRGPKAMSEAVAAGLTAGEHDVRIYMYGGVLGLIENKVGQARLSPVQVDRHAVLAALGFRRQEVIRSTDPDDAAAQAVRIVRGWLAANDNSLSRASEAA